MFMYIIMLCNPCVLSHVMCDWTHLQYMYIIHIAALYRYTPLMEAAREGHEDVVQLLVDHG